MKRSPSLAPRTPSRCPLIPPSGPERLVGLGFRCWLSGYRTGDIGCWERAWHTYNRAIGPERAKDAIGGLATWVRLIKEGACREIEVYPAQCPGFCADECLAVGMVAASQHGACPAMRACAVALLDNFLVDDVIDGARTFGLSLLSADQVLSTASVPLASRLEGAAAGPWH